MMKNYILTFFIGISVTGFSQFCDSFDLSLEDELEIGCANTTLTALHDQLGRDYLYAATSGGGLTIIDVSNPTVMEIETVINASEFEGLNVNSITQEGNYLYLALGNIFGDERPSGLGIVNIENPLAPTVEDVWFSSENGGGAFVGVQGNHAYLCGLSNGIYVLNISDKSAIDSISQYIPPTDWPAETELNKINARNIVLEEGVAYLAYDAGGVRVLDITNPSALTEIGRYSNPAMNGLPRAYNNIVKKDNLLYVAVDYAGVEILNVANVDDIILEGWWNPNGLPLATPFASAARWFNSPWHANELDVVEECGMLFFSGGRTEITGLDISNPADPQLCGMFGDSTDNIAAWGMSMYEDRIYAGLICTPLPIPFSGTWSGVKSLVYNSDCPLGIADEQPKQIDVNVYPNPAHESIQIQLPNEQNQLKNVSVYDLSGKVVLNDSSGKNTLQLQSINPGIYIVKMTIDGILVERKLIVQ